jgi:cyclopropane fatty-acyl-phospholipid synthase-like methyltransferase
MASEIEYWQKFWRDKTDPLHTHNNKNYYENYGKELSLLLPSQVKSVLELGCGSGSLYEPLGFNKVEHYVGIDLSVKMLDTFRETYPGLLLLEGRADTYKDNNKYDLIFTNGVIQYLSKEMLKEQINNALTMLTENGVIIHSSIPWKVLKKHYFLGQLMPPYKLNGVKACLSYIASSIGLKKDKMGHWYSTCDVEEIANDFDLSAKYYGSMYYPYRFHVTLKRV